MSRVRSQIRAKRRAPAVATPSEPAARRLSPMLAAAFGLSGVAGLVYERVGYDLAYVFFGAAAIVVALSAAFIPDVGRADLAAHRTGGPPRRRMFGFNFGSSGTARSLNATIRPLASRPSLSSWRARTCP